MKLKEKLAEEVILNSGISKTALNGAIYDSYLRVYLAGFEKARELALHITYILVDDDASTTAGRLISSLGEEEV